GCRRHGRNPYRSRRRLFVDGSQRMTLPKFRSLQFRLALRVTAFYAVAAFIVVGVLIVRAYDIDATLDRRNLSIRAENLAAYVSRDATGTVHLDLPPRLEAVYASK